MPEHKSLPVLSFRDDGAWDAWLQANGEAAPGVWLRLVKKGSEEPGVGKLEAIATALAHGWVDGQIDKWDAQSWLVRYTPRKARSKWSQINCETAERLSAEGRMRPAGRRQIDAAKADGRWEAAYPPASRAEVPQDLAAALAAEPEAERFFATLTGANRYAVLYRIGDAKTAATRAARVAKFTAMLARGETIHSKKG